MSKNRKCRFPVARIKKIMQADDEVGKIAKDTPVLVSKALELFVTQLITQSADLSVTKNSNSIHPCYIKQCINKNDMWDFLKDVVESVPDTEPDVKKTPKKKGSKNDGDDNEEDEDDGDDV
eukprot:TRINITY_DN922_c0_g1_i2.p1 TRINITY_DN922_c0_g1~~TRINITY_DN922_c0_g1_i2.p1  ORF type:complete len:121 (+),score=10.59 TRINITY_DN922_c0_g1_i2:389-751(+)